MLDSSGLNSVSSAETQRGVEISLPLRYRNHLIIEKATFDQQTGFWSIRAHIQYNENIEFRDILITPIEQFRTRRAAERYIFTKGKEWVDNRLERVKPPVSNS